MTEKSKTVYFSTSDTKGVSQEWEKKMNQLSLSELEAQHHELHGQVADLEQVTHGTHPTLPDLKRKKLKLKDEINRLKQEKDSITH